MDFTMNEQEKAIRTMASKFARIELKKVAIKVEEDDQPPSRDIVKNLQSKVYLGLIFKQNTVEVVLGTSKQY